jgi:hypothetical protein
MDGFQRETMLLAPGCEVRIVSVSGRLTISRIDVAVPLPDPWHKFGQASQQRNQVFRVPAVSRTLLPRTSLPLVIGVSRSMRLAGSMTKQLAVTALS